LLNQTTDDQFRGHLYHFLGSIKDDQGDYVQARSLIEKALEIYQRTLRSTHPDFITAFNNISAVYEKMGDHSKAFSYNEKLVGIREVLSPNHTSLAVSHNNFGFLCFQKKDYSTALSYYEKALAIYQEILPANHSSLSICYNNLAGVYNSIHEYDTALSYLHIALDGYIRICNNIRQQFLFMNALLKLQNIYRLTIILTFELMRKTWNQQEKNYYRFGIKKKKLHCYIRILLDMSKSCSRISR